MNLFLADFLKLKRPLMLWLSLAMAVGAIGIASMGQQRAATQLRRDQVALRAAQTTQPQDGQPREQVVLQARQQLRNSEADTALIGATQSWLGALGLALDLTCSALGVVILLLAACAHVGGEWSHGTMKEVLIASGRRGRLIGAKMITLFVFGGWLVVCSWVGLALWGVVSRHLYPINHPASPSVTADWVLPMAWRAPLVVLFFVALAVMLTIIVRNSVAALLAAAVVLLGANIFGEFGPWRRLSPASWVSTLMRFADRPYFSSHYWVGSLSKLSPLTSALALAGLSAVLTLVAIAVIHGREAMRE